MYRPLADELRPEGLEEVFGQERILGEQGMLRRVIESGTIPNLIFYGPSGTGKTTVANIIAKRTQRALRRINATTAGIADIKAVIDELDTMLAPNGILLYLDEIQYFNKKQQQSLLEFIESGKITLIASTTENPYFCVFNAILSRSTIFEFRQLSPEAIAGVLGRAAARLQDRDKVRIVPEEGVLRHISLASGGDARKAVNALELLYLSANGGKDGVVTLGLADAKEISQRSAMRYDRDGDEHYDIVSALQKSIRGSDPDAAVHYLARLIEAGDFLSACRRLMVIACEDVGLAFPQIIPIVKACVDAAIQLGLPEARIPLADAAVLMATSPKSNSAYAAFDRALADVRQGKTGHVPRHLQNVHADSHGQEREQGYLYPHSYPGHYVPQQYLPDELSDARYYEYGENKAEQAAKKYWEIIKGIG